MTDRAAKTGHETHKERAEALVVATSQKDWDEAYRIACPPWPKDATARQRLGWDTRRSLLRAVKNNPALEEELMKNQNWEFPEQRK